MIFLAILFFFLIYLAISTGVVLAATRWAKKRNRRPWVWGGLAAFVMYNLMFWDWIPTLVAHKYYCSTQAGFWVYKTPEEWRQENPGVAETLKESLEPAKVETTGNTKRYWSTQRFFYEVARVRVFPSLSRSEKKFFDAKTGALIARSVNYSRGQSGNVIALGGTPDEIRQALVLGWGNRQCGSEGNSPTDMFDQYIYQFWKWGEGK